MSANKKILIVGYGSIGRRHATLFSKLGSKIYLVTSRMQDDFICYKTISDAIDSEKIDIIVVANITSKHFESLKEIDRSHFNGLVLVEKPIFDKVCYYSFNTPDKILVAYNFRFHPIIQGIKKILMQESILSISVRAGQYLPDWREGRDYRKTYSAVKKLGGGVIRDLSHELDYINYFCGKCKRVAAIGGKYSDLDIDSDDIFSIVMACDNCPIISVNLNYLDKNPRREILINTKTKTIYADLISNKLCINGKLSTYKIERNNSYTNMHESMLAGNYSQFCSFYDGMYVLELIEKIEFASQQSRWVHL
jgi:predicted dehydrogenase